MAAVANPAGALTMVWLCSCQGDAGNVGVGIVGWEGSDAAAVRARANSDECRLSRMICGVNAIVLSRSRERCDRKIMDDHGGYRNDLINSMKALDLQDEPCPA
jgi:hypothetical protein